MRKTNILIIEDHEPIQKELAIFWVDHFFLGIDVTTF